MQPLELSAVDLVTAIRQGEVSAVQVAEAFLGRIAKVDGSINAFLHVDREAALARAADIDARRKAGKPLGALAGLPVAVKDALCTSDQPTTCASKMLAGFRPPYDAHVVAKLRQADAVLVGKTNMDEFAMGSSNENSAYGGVSNPWDRTRVPGGSSGGSAAAVAGGLAPCALGTDTGGSIRQPAALCGIVGLKPTYGAISRFGMIAFASSLDQCGPLTRTVADAALLLEVMQGQDQRDSTSVGLEAPIELPSSTDLDGVRFGVPAELVGGDVGIEAGVREVFEQTLSRIEELGGEVAEVTLPHAAHGISAYYVLAPAEASSNLARYDGVRYGLRVEADDLVSMYERTRSEGFGPEVKRRIMLGTYALSSGYYDAYYAQAQKVRTRIAEDFTAAFQGVDFVVTPTSPTVAFPLGARTQDPLSMYLSDFCTVPMSLAGIPAISIPAGLAAPPEGGPELPVGFQIAAPAFGEQDLLEAAHALEMSIGFQRLDQREGESA